LGEKFWAPTTRPQAFDELKDYIQQLPTLSSQEPRQPLILYSGAQVQERETLKNDKKMTQQVPIYFISKALATSKRYYSEMEKIYYTVVMNARKLCHYFEAHRVSPHESIT
jgi:hypothetical protein